MTMERDHSKWLRADRLIELLRELPPDAQVECNQVRNLLVLTPDGTKAIAYIDFVLDGSIELMD